MIEFKNISLFRNDKTIFDRCSFSIEEGEKLVISGPSGSGKSTMLNLIAGLVEPDSGEIFFGGTGITSANIAKIRSGIAFIGQEPVLGAATIKEALLLPFTFRANAAVRPEQEEIESVLDALLLDKDIQTKNADEVSGGEKQRIAIARAVLLKKKIFLADEITSALDNRITESLFSFFKKDEYTLVSVSHDEHWIDLCSRHVRLENGKLEVIRKKEENTDG